MKKLLTALICTLAAFVLAIGASADHLWVKDAYFTDDYGKSMIALLHDGVLIYGETDKMDPVILTDNVREFSVPKTWPYENATVVYNDNSISLVKYDRTKREVVLTGPFDVNARTVVRIPKPETGFEYMCIDNNGVLSGRRNEEKFDIMSGVVKAEYSSEYLYILNTNGELFSYKCSSSIKNKPLSESSPVLFADEVKDFVTNGKDCVIVTNNSELYVSENAKDVKKVAGAVSSVDKVVFEDNAFYYITDSATAYKYRLRITDRDITDPNLKISDNAEKLYIRNKLLYVVSNDGTGNTFIVEQDAKKVKSLTFYTSGVERFYDNIVDLYQAKDNTLCAFNRFTEETIPYGISDVAFVKHTDKVWIILKNTGELLITEGDVRNLKTPELVKFCERRTKLVINGKEIILETPVQIVEGRSMYPLRQCLESMGARVIWDSVINTAMGKVDAEGLTIRFPVGAAEYYVNDVRYPMDIASYIDASLGRTYVPIRYAAEGLGYTVGWEAGPTSNTITLTKK